MPTPSNPMREFYWNFLKNPPPNHDFVLVLKSHTTVAATGPVMSLLSSLTDASKKWDLLKAYLQLEAENAEAPDLIKNIK